MPIIFPLKYKQPHYIPSESASNMDGKSLHPGQDLGSYDKKVRQRDFEMITAGLYDGTVSLFALGQHGIRESLRH
jgi:hypothetical protein